MKYYTTIPSPIGNLVAVSDGTSLTGLFFQDQLEKFPAEYLKNDELPLFQATRIQINEFFSGKRKEFQLPLSPQGTPFQTKVWDLLLKIPFGTTQTYHAVANLTGNPKSVRAVGQAVGRNPIAIIIPCHRVIGSNGKLTGYGGGLKRKAALLEFESAVASEGD